MLDMLNNRDTIVTICFTSPLKGNRVIHRLQFLKVKNIKKRCGPGSEQLITVLLRLRQENCCEFEAILNYI